MRVGVDRAKYQIKIPLPPRIDPSVGFIFIYSYFIIVIIIIILLLLLVVVVVVV